MLIIPSKYRVVSLRLNRVAAKKMSLSLPYVNGINGAMSGSKRTMANWGSPLPTRKLNPHEDVQFDPSLKPRAHRMAGNA